MTATTTPEFWLTLARGEAPVAPSSGCTVDNELLRMLAGVSQQADNGTTARAQLGASEALATRFLRELAGLTEKEFARQIAARPPTDSETDQTPAVSSRSTASNTLRVIFAIVVVVAALAIGYFARSLWDVAAKVNGSSILPLRQRSATARRQTVARRDYACYRRSADLSPTARNLHAAVLGDAPCIRLPTSASESSRSVDRAVLGSLGNSVM